MHSATVSGEFWEAIGWKISNSMNYKVYLEGMEECYILEPLVIQGLSYSVNLGISLLTRNNLKLICTEDEVELMPIRDRSVSRAR